MLVDEEISPNFIQVISELNSDINCVDYSEPSNSKGSKGELVWDAVLEECDKEIEKDVMKQFTDSSSPINQRKLRLLNGSMSVIQEADEDDETI